MIGVAIQNEEPIKAYCRRHADLCDDMLSEEDWAVLCNMHTFLKELRATTLDLECAAATLDSVLPAMDYILNQFEQHKQTYRHHPVLAPMFNSGWTKMEKYYILSDKSSAYVAGIVLNPNLK